MNLQNVQFETSFGHPDQLVESTVPEFVFVGRSNVGKSSLINKFFNRKQLARTSSMPGKTATINFFACEGIRFVDLPGYGYAKVSKCEKEKWNILIQSYFESERNILLVFSLIDMRHSPTKDDLVMINYLIEQELPFVIILTKQDKLSKKQQTERMEKLMSEIPYAEQITILPVSSQTGAGILEMQVEVMNILTDYKKELSE